MSPLPAPLIRATPAGWRPAAALRLISAAVLALATLTAAPAHAQQRSGALTPATLDELAFREIGPAVTGGRIHDVEALPEDPSVVYVAAASGGIWKSENMGTTWTPIFDDQPVSTFGDIAIAPSDRQVIWAGTGEQNNRQSTSWGNGVYRSTDGGATWTHLGLEETRHIGRVRVHPTDADVAWVAALGNLWAPGEERGVFKTDDGGRTWRKTLFVDENTGAVDLVLDPSNPNVLYAAAYQRQRRAWGYNGGGPGSGIYKSTDGGESWSELTNGLPVDDMGRIGLAIAESSPNILNAIVETSEDETQGMYRSEDAGATWTRVNELNARPSYYSHIYIDPNNPDRVYSLAVSFYKSEDGGRSWRTMPTRQQYDVGVHSDFHALWIDPNNSKHLILVGDGGVYQSWDMAEHFTRVNNVPVAQAYGIGADGRDPYYLYVGLQDNHSWQGPNATRHWIGILGDDWQQIGFSDGMYHQVDPMDPENAHYVFSNNENGGYTRVDAFTGDILNIEPPDVEGERNRFDWVAPSLLSRHDPRVFYAGGNRLFISRDRGSSWSWTEDLTRQIDRDTLAIMGVLGADIEHSRNDGTSTHSEIVTIAESPLDGRILWVGTDDGNVQVSRDGGATWNEVSGNVNGVRNGTYVSRVHASRRAPGTAYATFDAHRDGDFRPYVFRTTDFGASWENLSGGLPDGAGSVNVIAEHPANPDVLALGAEHGLFVSGDAGTTWLRYGGGLPTTLYDDLLFHPRYHDLIVATHGRGLWILDDARPLAMTAAVAQAAAHLFPIRPATMLHKWKDTSYRGQDIWTGENPPEGAIITYALGNAAPTATLSVTNAVGRTIATLESDDAPGVHRVIWDLRHAMPGGRGEGPFVMPGTYTVTLAAGGTTARQQVEVRGDPAVAVSASDQAERERFFTAILDLMAEAEALAPRVQDEELADRLQGASRDASRLIGTYMGSGVRPGSMYPPTQTHLDALAEARAEVDAVRRAVGG